MHIVRAAVWSSVVCILSVRSSQSFGTVSCRSPLLGRSLCMDLLSSQYPIAVTVFVPCACFLSWGSRQCMSYPMLCVVVLGLAFLRRFSLHIRFHGVGWWFSLYVLCVSLWVSCCSAVPCVVASLVIRCVFPSGASHSLVSSCICEMMWWHLFVSSIVRFWNGASFHASCSSCTVEFTTQQEKASPWSSPMCCCIGISPCRTTTFVFLPTRASACQHRYPSWSPQPILFMHASEYSMDILSKYLAKSSSVEALGLPCSTESSTLPSASSIAWTVEYSRR